MRLVRLRGTPATSPSSKRSKGSSQVTNSRKLTCIYRQIHASQKQRTVPYCIFHVGVLRIEQREIKVYDYLMNILCTVYAVVLKRLVIILIMSLSQCFHVICAFYYVSDVSKVSVLIPGAGLGRLAWEIARLGYTCQGNEWSLFMLFSSNFVLNRCSIHRH